MPGRAKAAVAALLLLALAAGCEASHFPDAGTPDDSGGASLADPLPPAEAASGPPAPLTGLPVEDAVVDRPAVAVTVAGAPSARPAVGLSEADLVVAEPADDGERYLAVFQSRLPSSVGPVAAPRALDATLLPPLVGVLAGGSPSDDVLALLRHAGVVLREEGQPLDAWVREPERRAPHNVFVSPEQLPPADAAAPEAPWPFGQEDVGGGVEVPRVSWTRPAGVQAAWEWDGASARWVRATPTVGAASVVLVRVPSVDGLVSGSAAAATTGEGDALVLADGRAVEARWSRSPGEPFAWTTSDGAPLPIRPGPVWIELVPAGAAVETVPATVG